jgi:hypothetical protein
VIERLVAFFGKGHEGGKRSEIQHQQLSIVILLANEWMIDEC